MLPTDNFLRVLERIITFCRQENLWPLLLAPRVQFCLCSATMSSSSSQEALKAKIADAEVRIIACLLSCLAFLLLLFCAVRAYAFHVIVQCL